MRKLKDKKFRVATIKIDLLREVTKIGNGYSYKDKMYLVEVDSGYSKTYFNGKDEKSILKEIKRFI